MTVTTRTVGDATILNIQGALTIGEPADRLRDRVCSLLLQGADCLLVNLAGITYIDSAGLGELVAVYVTTMRHGGTLKLVNATKRIADLLRTTKLATVFEAFDDEVRSSHTSATSRS